ncbi:MAG: putative sugar acetyltransferase [Acidimicrobiia bacterium]|nr:putative sugar acetyltransferase [Acidimicrobiia bacterium]
MSLCVRPLRNTRGLRDTVEGWASDAIHAGWEEITRLGAIRAGTRRGARFGSLGDSSFICFPPTAIMNERHISIGHHTLIGSHVTLSAGMAVGQDLDALSPVVTIGNRCMIGRGSGIVGHLSIHIGDDVWTGHHVYITDQNHGYEDLSVPISQQAQPERPVRIGNGSWLGHGTVVLPGSIIGAHVAVGAGSVVNGELPDYSVCAGAPARPVRQLVDGDWVRR